MSCNIYEPLSVFAFQRLGAQLDGDSESEIVMTSYQLYSEIVKKYA